MITPPSHHARPPRDHAGSPDRFGYEWSHYSTILEESRGQLQRWLGSTGLHSVRGKRVLDVGCGMGRNPYWFVREGAREVVAVDIDPGSLEAARRNLAEFPNVHVQECSAYDLAPATLGRFDSVTCIGVLHHLQEPERALQRMWDCVAPGGDLLLWCYAREGNRMFLPVIQALRFVGSRVPIRVTHLLARAATAGALPPLAFWPWRTDYYRRLRQLSVANIESIIFDQILPLTTHYWTQDEMMALLAPLHGEKRLEFVQGNSWHVRIRKPLEDSVHVEPVCSTANRAFYDDFWQRCSDFTRYNPGARHRRRMVLRMTRPLQPRSVADVGCGTGELLVSVAQTCPSVSRLCGFDLSPKVVEANQRTLTGMEFHALDIGLQTFPEQFDLVLCCEVLEHLENRATAYHHLAAMVAPGGHLLVTCPTGRVFATEKHFGHFAHPNAEELRHGAAAAGLHLVSLRNWGFPTFRAMKWATNFNPGWALRNFGGGRYSPLGRAVSNALYVANALNLPSSTHGCQLVALFRKPG